MPSLKIRIPRLVIAGTHSGVGKTTIATALMAALARRGMRVQPFKVGPDFIDPAFHVAACGRPSRNLDGWMLSREVNAGVFARACAAAEIAVIEGVMGLFDGRSAVDDAGSTAEMAKWLGAPVLLVADASAMARSAAALVRGFETFDPGLDIAGVLFNRTGGRGHAAMLREAAAAYCRARPLGELPADDALALPSRNLGLTMPAEALTGECLAGMARWAEDHADIDGLVELARERSAPLDVAPLPAGRAVSERVRIGVARDAAFCFYYQDNLDMLEECGAELVDFSPIRDRQLPHGLSGLYLGGGYPELHAAGLADNRPMLDAIRGFVDAGAPVYGECGGFMYLTEAIVDANGREHAMAGVFPTRARMQPRLAALGYVEPQARADLLWLRAGERMRGQEFRYSEIDPVPANIARAYCSPAEAYTVRSVLGSYIHLHFRSCPEFPARFVAQCARWSSLCA